MNYRMAFIGPGRLLNQIFSKLHEVALDDYFRIAGAVITDEVQLSHSVSCYSDWKELLRECNADCLNVLTRDKELRKEIRSGLPDDIDLTEEMPGKSAIINILAKSVYRRKLEKKIMFLNKMVESVPFPAISFNWLGFVSMWNSNCEKFTGVPAREVIGRKNIGRSFYYQERPLAGQMLVNGSNIEQFREYYSDPETEITLQDDSVLISGFMDFKGSMPGYYQITAQKVFLEGDVIGAVEMIQDLNTITILQEEATRKQAALHSIVSHLPFPMIQSTSTGEVMFVNRAGKVFLGREDTDQHDSEGMNLFTYRPEILEEFSGFINSLSADAYGGYFQESQFSRTLFWDDSHWDVTCLCPPGQELELIWIIRNVSLREKESQLNTALAMVGTICHELSQPLTAIINSAKLLARTDLKDVERAARHQKIIDEQGERLFSIYRKLQNITQVRMQKYLDTQILDLDESVDELRVQKIDRE